MNNLIVIASAQRQAYTQSLNNSLHIQAIKKMGKLATGKIFSTIGYYKEEGQEASIEASMMFSINANDFDTVYEYFCTKRKQDSILIIEPSTLEAKLIDDKGRMFPLGKMQTVSKEEAIANGAYTLCRSKYWIAK